MTIHPLRYEPAYETPEPDEAETTGGLVEALRGIAETTYRDYGYPVRSVHAKSHGLLRGELQVLEGLPAAYAQGLFAQLGRYPVVLRFSTNPGDILDDSVSVPRGLAVKVVGVEGARLPGSEAGREQDFVLVNAPTFAAPTAKAFLGNLKLLAKTTDRAPGLKKVLSAALRGTEAALEAVGGKSATLTQMGGHPNTHILGDNFYSGTPFLFGASMAKFSVAPVSPALLALKDAKVKVSGRPDALREEVLAFFAGNTAEWELRVQLCTDIGEMPIEDSTVEWPETMSPYVAVARITAGPQPSWNEERSRAVDLGMAFNPWQGLAAHRPLGSINRTRRAAYRMSADFREARSGCPMHHPRGEPDLPI
ncbi:catalase family protein [Roseomonas sp. 18066]|uniref:catalase family protein n=1 Tax=Roseomonas sp. 18066 TaxID=2681412 RepID=UPI0013592F74|nr:catalase family protein [Roseomonas sp. 18066]